MYPDPKNGNRDVWTIEIDRGIAAPLTRNAANDWHPVWSGDGKQMLFASDRGGKPETMLYIKTAMDAAAEETQLLATFGSPTDWSRDGRWIAVDEYPLNQSGPTTLIVSSRDRTAKRLIDTQSRHGGTRFSPDGKWVAYTSEETGRFEVFVRPFANGEAGREKIQISESGGDFPVWRPDGQELFFMSEDGTIHAVATSDASSRRLRPTPGNALSSVSGERSAIAANDRAGVGKSVRHAGWQAVHRQLWPAAVARVHGPHELAAHGTPNSHA